MKRVFADTAYFVALARKQDQLHRQAMNLQKYPPGQLLTTEWILTEVADRLADPPAREEFIRLLDQLRMRADVKIIPVSHEYFQQGCELYARRKDKEWSLTDCISFIVMKEYGIDSALTSDEDFEQAGFQRLMDPGPQGVREPALLYGPGPCGGRPGIAGDQVARVAAEATTICRGSSCGGRGIPLLAVQAERIELVSAAR
jgi:predicted nucleic acid-binding protein